MNAASELRLYLRPAGGGVHLVSTGLDEQRAMQRSLFGVSDDAQVLDAFHAQLEAASKARAVIVAVPSDVGAGFRRGANLGPAAIRRALLGGASSWAQRLRGWGALDLGDVFVVPQLLHDEMLSDGQRARTQAALYEGVPLDARSRLAVSPLSVAERVFDLLLAENPELKIFVLGGDHSVAWPAVHALSRVRRDRWAIVQPDAHTDLLEERLGVRYCFATWSFHANELLGRDGRLVQVGIRASRHDRAHWERTLGARQLWADECNRDPDAAIAKVVAHLESLGVESVYFSNDIDATSAEHAPATGTPEPDGLAPPFLFALLEALGARFELIGGDVVEVAPPLGPTPEDAARTVALAARYFEATLAAALDD